MFERKSDRNHTEAGWRRALLLGSALTLTAGCNTFSRLEVQPVPPGKRSTTAAQAEAAGATERPKTGVKLLSPGARTAVEGSRTPVIEATAADIAALLPERQISATLPPQPITQFIETVFGQILQVPYFTGPGVARRRDIVSLSGPVQMSNRTFFALVQQALRQYGLAVTILNGSVQVVESDLLAYNAPLFMRVRSLPETPQASRPVIQFASLENVEAATVTKLLQQVYTDGGVVRFAAQEPDNGVVISGNQQEVAAAANLAQVIDQPSFAGAQVARLEPVFWQAQPLAEAVRDIMMREGFLATVGANGSAGALTLMPVPYANSILVFSDDTSLFQRALFWIQELDSPAAFQDQEGVFIYHVQNTTAAELGQLVAQLTPGSTPPPTGDRTLPLTGDREQLPRPADRVGEPIQKPVTNGRITIDPGGNRILYRGTRTEFAQLRALMVELDTPPKQVLVEITIAEVTLTDETRFGFEFFLDTVINGGNLTIDTRGPAAGSRELNGLGATFTKIFSDGSRLLTALNALATNSNLNILSTPRLVARSGSAAQILVGSDVPIITSQRAAESQSEGDTDILQTVQYRQTGVVLNMRPVVYGADRVDIELFQEVSSVGANLASNIDSPVILNRSVTTQLSLREGMTAVIGGLIQDNLTRNQRGVPLLKDIPILGELFRVDSTSSQKTELLLLVTPYILRNDQNVGEASAVYSASINRLLNERGPQVYTLYPFRSIFDSRPVTHGGRLLKDEPAAPPPPPQ